MYSTDYIKVHRTDRCFHQTDNKDVLRKNKEEEEEGEGVEGGGSAALVTAAAIYWLPPSPFCVC